MHHVPTIAMRKSRLEKSILNREGWHEAWVDDNRILGWECNKKRIMTLL